MKVLFTFYNPSGGMETLNRIRSKALIDKGIEAHLLYNFTGEGLRNIKDIRTIVTSDDESVRTLIQQENYDVIVVCSDINMLENISNSSYTGHLIYELQGLGPIEEAKLIVDNYSERILEHADAILYPQTLHLNQLMLSYFPNIPQFSFDDPLDTEHFGYHSYPRKSFPILGWIGRIQANKNWREFLTLGERLMQYCPDLFLWMFVDKTLHDPIEKAAYDLMVTNSPQLSTRLFLYSNIPHDTMADYLSIIGDSGGFLASTSILEGFGYAVAEAMLCRCPVLSTDSDGVRRFVAHNQTGKFYERGNIDEAVAEALSLMQDQNLRTQIIDNAQAHIKREFSTDLYVERFMNMKQHLDYKSPKKL
ncbi:glycosyltransferase family 4 protein [Paenibacillus pini]|uniref:Glycosyl transferase family 1 domain-containing protein n=1 Tax=Paenibacillus pini JCM 16418 TaxID=1236976 RepID=W7YPB2_9BACL|nr:glycosyltransferase family 4 protein [Paenibacillus pini]GAF09458.1 hypothetical protein JCM16418_3599 [Paenibacillus pini JCM 16418]